MAHNLEFYEEAGNLIAKYPSFKIETRGEYAVIVGVLYLTDESGNEIDKYAIEIQSGVYPDLFPLVFEIGGRIPKNVEWHVYPKLGNCCLDITVEEKLRCLKGLTLIAFLEEMVIPYFFNQTYRRVNGFYLNEHGHGIIGLKAYYQDLFNITDLVKIIQLIDKIITTNAPLRTSYCFCGSNIKFRNCHKLAYLKLKPLDATFLNQQINELRYLHLLTTLT